MEHSSERRLPNQSCCLERESCTHSSRILRFCRLTHWDPPHSLPSCEGSLVAHKVQCHRGPVGGSRALPFIILWAVKVHRLKQWCVYPVWEEKLGFAGPPIMSPSSSMLPTGCLRFSLLSSLLHHLTLIGTVSQQQPRGCLQRVGLLSLGGKAGRGHCLGFQSAAACTSAVVGSSQLLGSLLLAIQSPACLSGKHHAEAVS